jgi:hypothetical protein
MSRDSREKGNGRRAFSVFTPIQKYIQSPAIGCDRSIPTHHVLFSERVIRSAEHRVFAFNCMFKRRIRTCSNLIDRWIPTHAFALSTSCADLIRASRRLAFRFAAFLDARLKAGHDGG